MSGSLSSTNSKLVTLKVGVWKKYRQQNIAKQNIEILLGDILLLAGDISSVNPL